MSSDRGDGTELVRGLIGTAFQSLIDDTKRSQDLLREAIPRVVSSFNGLQTQVQQQVSTVEQISKSLGGAENRGGFSEGMRVIIDTFVKDLIAVSQQSMRIVERVMLMGRDVDSALKNVAEIDTMAHTTRFIAINAQIEAFRTNAGNSFRIVADETKHLARDAAAFSSEIRDAVVRCKDRLNETRELVGKLASHDMTVALSVQDHLARTLASVDGANAQLLSTLKELEANVRVSITALQFDDILMQLLGSIGNRIELLRTVWLESLPPELPPQAARQLIDAWQRHAARLTARNPVAQENLDAGTAELF